MLHPDAPIVKLEDDALSRVEYAKGIAESIAAYAPTDSVVFGIVGPRGSGKSSLINLIVKSLEHHPHSSPNLNDTSIQHLRSHEALAPRRDSL